jgi:hypothetical protein
MPLTTIVALALEAENAPQNKSWRSAMRACLFLFAVTLSVASPVALSAQEAPAVPQMPNAAATAAAAPAQPATATPAAAGNPIAPGARPAPNGQKVACEYTTHEGMLVSLNHCVSQSEAARIRRDQQQTFREYQLNSLTYRGSRP